MTDSAQPERSSINDIPERTLRSLMLTLSQQRWLGRAAMATPVVRPMVSRFVAGQSLDEVLDALADLQERGLQTTVDALGEAVTSDEEARAAAARYLETLDALADHGLVRNVSLKLSQMGLGLSQELCRENVERIFRRAAELDAFVRIDMEDRTTTDATLALYRELRPANPRSGVVIQAALHRSADDIEALIAEQVPVRLCKGAYKEAPSVAFIDRAEIDANYAALMTRLLRDGAHTALATHDARLIAQAIRLEKAEGIGRDRFEFQMLYGIRSDLQERLVRAGYTVRVYVPFGAQWYPYFMRRLAERPANIPLALRSVLSGK